MMTTKVMVLCLAAVLLSCSNASLELKNAVTAYNKMLTEALAKPDEQIMEYFTSDDEKSRIGAYILRLKTEKKIMVSNLLELRFSGTEVAEGGNKAAVRTAEQWTFYYADFKTRERITEEEAIGYENTYHLIKESGHWVIDRIDIKEK